MTFARNVPHAWEPSAYSEDDRCVRCGALLTDRVAHPNGALAPPEPARSLNQVARGVWPSAPTPPVEVLSDDELAKQARALRKKAG